MSSILCLSMLLVEGIMFSAISFGAYKKFWNPVLLCCSMIIFASFLTFFNKEISPAKSEEGLLWIGIGSFLFVLSFFLAQGWRQNTSSRQEEMVYRKSFLSFLMLVCVILSIVSMLINLKIVVEIAGDFSMIFLNSTRVRNEYLERGEGGGLLTFITLFANINFYCLYCLFPQAIKRHCRFVILELLIVLLVRLFASIITMSKDAFIVDLLVLISAYSCSFNGWRDELKFAKKYMLIFALLFIALIVVIGFQRNYMDSIGGGPFEVVVKTLREYIGVSFQAFCSLISYPSRDFGGEQCFRPIINILSRFGLADRVSIFQDSIAGGDTNVFSIFGNMYNDFGFWGILFLSVFFGLFLGGIYYPYKTNSIGRMVCNSMVLMSMFFVFYDLKIMQTIYLFIIFYSFILENILKSALYVKEA